MLITDYEVFMVKRPLQIYVKQTGVNRAPKQEIQCDIYLYKTK